MSITKESIKKAFIELIKKRGEDNELAIFNEIEAYLGDSTVDKVVVNGNDVLFYYNANTGDCDTLEDIELQDLVGFLTDIALELEEFGFVILKDPVKNLIAKCEELKHEYDYTSKEFRKEVVSTIIGILREQYGNNLNLGDYDEGNLPVVFLYHEPNCETCTVCGLSVYTFKKGAEPRINIDVDSENGWNVNDNNLTLDELVGILKMLMDIGDAIERGEYEFDEEDSCLVAKLD